MIPLGLWVAWRRDRTWGFIIVGASAAWMAVAYDVIIRAFLGTASFNFVRIPFGGVGGLVTASW